MIINLNFKAFKNVYVVIQYTTLHKLLRKKLLDIIYNNRLFIKLRKK